MASAVMIATTVGVVVAGTEIARLTSKKNPTFPPLIAGFAMGTGLFAVNIASPEVAKLFCVLILVSSLLLNGPAIFRLATPKTK